MIDAAPARWCVLLLGFELACGRRRADGALTEGESAHGKAALTALQGASSAVAAASPSRGGLEFGASSALGRWPAVAASTVSRGSEPAVSGVRPSEPVGGRWVSCYANYRATSAPERDVTRLAALCGPSNGMVPVGPITGGDAADAAEDHRLEAAAGDCFRIFAVADAFVNDLGLEVTNPRGNAITWDRNGDRWPIVNPDGPFCVFETGTYTVRVRALSGKGRYAMQVWRLP